MAETSALVQRVLAGEVPAAARACRIVDEGWAGASELLEALYPHIRGAWLIGVTGSPGVGKSTLTSALVRHLRREGERVGVVAVDPTSPFSGGAILGDRIRMQEHFQDPEVFIRSLATRGAMGGLSRTSADIARVLMAWGARVVVLETVGVGQDELDVMRVAHSTLVVQAPGAGDDVQAAKAGLMECADVFVVNKADLPGAEATLQELRAMLALSALTRLPSRAHGGGHGGGRHSPAPAADAARSESLDSAFEVPVLAAVATRDEGVAEALAALRSHRQWLDTTREGSLRRRARLREELAARITYALASAVLERHGTEIERALDRITLVEGDPYSESRALIQRLLDGASPAGGPLPS